MSKTVQQALKPIVIECFNDCFGYNKKKEIEYEDELVDYVIEKFRQSDYWKNNFPQNIDDNDINYVMLKILIKTVVTGMLEKVMSFGNI